LRNIIDAEIAEHFDAVNNFVLQKRQLYICHGHHETL